MSTGTPETPQNPAGSEVAGARKGLPTLAKVGIGCAVLLALGLITLGVVGYLVKDKVSEFASSYEENPALAAAKMMEKLGGDIEVIDSDDDAGTVTVRDKKSGQTLTVSFEDIEDGKISFSSDEGNVTLETDDKERGQVRIQSDDGELIAGGGDADALPEWTLLHRGARPTDVYTLSSPEQITGGYTFESDASLEETMDGLERGAKRVGLAIQHRTTTSSADGKLGMLTAADEETERFLHITGESTESGCTVHVNYGSKPE